MASRAAQPAAAAGRVRGSTMDAYLREIHAIECGSKFDQCRFERMRE